MNKNGRDHWRSSSPASLLKQGPLEQVAQDCIPIILEYFLRGRLNNISGQPVPVLGHPPSKGVILHVQVELPLSACCLFCYCSASLGRAWFHSLDIPPSDIYRHWSLLCCLFSRQKRTCSLCISAWEMLQSSHRLCNLMLDSFQEHHISM